MTGSWSLLPGSSIRFDSLLQLLAGTERHHATRRIRDFLTCLGVTPRALALVTQIEITKTGHFDLPVGLKGETHLFKEHLDEFIRLALVEAKLLKQPLGHVGLGQRSHCLHSLNAALTCCFKRLTALSTQALTSSSVRVREACWKVKPSAKLRLLSPTPVPS